jgi:hypothetical protein
VVVLKSILADPAWDYVALGHLHRYIPIKHTVRPSGQKSVIKPGQSYCLARVPATKPAAVVEVFHNGNDFDLVVRLKGKDLSPVYTALPFANIGPDDILTLALGGVSIPGIDPSAWDSKSSAKYVWVGAAARHAANMQAAMVVMENSRQVKAMSPMVMITS